MNLRIGLVLLVGALPGVAATCDSLAGLSLKQAKVTLAAEVAPGAFAPAQGNPAPFKTLPAFCRVAATLTPTTDSDIKIEVWLPVINANNGGWNRDLQSVGNGAWAGTLSYPAMAGALAAGYATASTDTGHLGNTAESFFGHPEKFNDFGYRSIHEMTVAAKAIVKAYYGSAPRHSFFNGCSTGGRQALTEAQRYPADYDGIIAGAPANFASRLQGMQVWAYQMANATPATFMERDQLTMLNNAVLAACDALDGVKDGTVENPRRCQFDPAVLACKPGESGKCLNDAQVDFARKMYAGPSEGGQQMFPGLEKGSEAGWQMIATRKPMALAEDVYKMANADAKWTGDKFNWTADLPKAEQTVRGPMDANDPNLAPFFNRGGKLLMYHGWADPGIPPGNTLRYFGEVQKAVSKKAETSLRLFMVPGMGHCRGGGTDTFDAPEALSRWVERNEPPPFLAASRVVNGKTDRTRPLCPYPQQAVYSGTGSTDQASNFSCKVP
jgi:feruloyl esterase